MIYNYFQVLGMPYIINLVDEDQDYINFYIEEGNIIRSAPNYKPGWEGTLVLNQALIPGQPLHVQFHNGYDMPLPHLIADVIHF